MLSPFSFLYGVITSVRNWGYDFGVFKTTTFDVPIISVGNLAVGGSGKTPMVEFLISQLKGEYQIGVLSRGYGRKTTGFLWVESSLSPDMTGDEPLQVKTKYEDIAVAVCEKRVVGVRQILIDRPEINLIILDDAFQHRAISPSIQLVLSTYSKPFYEDWMMPSGRLRERRVGAKRADAVVFTKCPAEYDKLSWHDKPMFYSKIGYHYPIVEGPVYGFSGLADNGIFRTSLAENYNLSAFKGYSDHHSYGQKDIDEMLKLAEGATLVCTEKDWIKVKSLSADIKYVSITSVMEGGGSFISWIKSKIE